jgi:hypothetical protein
VQHAIQAADYRTALDHTHSAIGIISAALKSAPASSEVVAPLVLAPTPGDKTYLLVALNQVEQSLSGRDLLRGREYLVTLGTALLRERDQSQVSPSQELRNLQSQAIGADPFKRFLILPQMAKAAYGSGDLQAATSYANELLSTAQAHTSDSWPQGEAIHHGNIVAGRVALKGGDVETAKSRLLAAGLTNGSPALDSFGPNMALAADLLKAGQSSTVIQYLTECKRFWKMDNGSLAQWTALMQEGKTPDFGANLLF